MNLYINILEIKNNWYNSNYTNKKLDGDIEKSFRQDFIYNRYYFKKCYNNNKSIN